MSAPLKLIRTNVVPPGGFKYLQAETKRWIRAAHIEALERLVIEHRKANQIPVGTDIRGEIEQQICASLGPEWCNNAKPVRQGRLSFKALVQGTKTLVDWALKGGVRVPDEEANRRGAICSTCPMNQDSDGCTTCSGQELKEAVARFVAKSEVPMDRYLKNCQICSCGLRAKVRIPIEILHAHLTDEQQNLFPDFCWVKKPELKVA